MDWFRKQGGTLRAQDKRQIPDGLWVKCDKCNEIIYRKELERNYWVCRKCGYHFRIGYRQYIQILLDNGDLTELDAGLAPADPLRFKDSKRYPDRIKEYQQTTGMVEAAISGTGKMGGMPIVFSILDFAFLGGSMGSVVGEKIARAIRRATDLRQPLVVVSSSGGARMQEGILSLMQMAKTASLLAKMSEAGVFYVSILTDPAYAGVMASFASLGDIVIAEPDARLGFAGARVIKQTMGQDLPEGFQTSQFMLEHGFVDMVVPRRELKRTLVKILQFFSENERRAGGPQGSS